MLAGSYEKSNTKSASNAEVEKDAADPFKKPHEIHNNWNIAGRGFLSDPNRRSAFKPYKRTFSKCHLGEDFLQSSNQSDTVTLDDLDYLAMKWRRKRLEEEDIRNMKLLDAIKKEKPELSDEFIKKMEFDGTTVLCRVCGDKASGFHYGVHSCEGCKGFFRRSIQQKIQYRPCTKNQQCSILRINRNRCQYCRLKKCIAVGMSRDAVRFGRVPKREKAKILAAMQKVNANSQDKALVAELENEYKMMSSTVKAHNETCDYTKEKVAALFEKARTQPSYNQYSSQLVCPLNPAPHLMDGTEQYLQDFSERFAPAIQGVVEFAKRIPCFGFLSQCDQVTLLRAGAFEVLLVRLACMFDSQANSLICLNGQVLRRDSVQAGSNARFLLDSMFDFAERLNSLNLSDDEVGLFCSVVIISADRPGLRNTDLVLRVQKKLMDILQKSVSANHPENPNIFTELMKKIPDLRTLNTLHSEKLLAYKMEPALLNQQRQVGGTIEVIADTSVSSGNYSRLQQDLWGQYNLPVGHPPVALPEERSTSPGQHSNGSGSSTSSSEWSTTDSKDDHELVTSPSRSLCAEELRNPSLRSSFNPSHSYCHDEPWPSNPIQNAYECPNVMPLHIPKRAIETNGSDHGSSSGDEGYFVDSPMKAPLYPKLRRVDSPTDSGIESGKEHGPSLTPTISVCSSPRSSVDEKMKDVESSDKHESIEDMPVLKRALQAPPIVNPVTLMDEAYRHHKKFRAARREAESPSSPSSQMSLASTHSTLVKTLEQAPRYLSEQQLKSTNLLHHMIMAKETLTTQSPADSQTFVGQNNNHYPFHSVPTPSPPSSTSPQTHKMVNSQNGGYYSQPPQPQYSPAAAPVSWPAAQQHSPASTAPVQYEHQNSHPSSFGRSSPPRLLYAPRSSSPLVMHGHTTCTVQSSSEGKLELSQPLNLSKKLFSTPMLKMES